MKGLKDKFVLITGAAGGIGRALSLRFAEEGATVLATDIDESRLEETCELVLAAGGKCDTAVFDITDYAAVDNAVGVFVERHGGIDVLINNAGWDVAVQFLDTNPEDWQKIIAINLYGPLNLQHVVVKLFAKNGGGKVVNISSDAGRVGSSGEAVYSACKGGIIAFTKTLAREVARNNICVNVVCPGPTDTPVLAGFVGDGEYGQKILAGLTRAIPMRRIGQPEDVTGMVALLASDDAGFITGQTISVSGGLTMHG